MNIIILIWAILIGLVVGSFLNVCIYRLPKGISILFPASYCPDCNTKVAWFDNVPVLSYLILGGRCRDCRGRIHFRYILVELLSGLLTGGLCCFFIITGDKPLEIAICYIFLSYALILVSFIDIEYLIIPNAITYTGILIVLVLSIVFPAIHYDGNSEAQHLLSKISRLNSFTASVLGMTVSGGLIFITGLAGRCVFRKEAMGLGDAKLMCMVGGVIGWKLGVAVFFIAPFFGLLAAVPMRIIKKLKLIPYGPFLSLATILVIFLQDYFMGVIDMYIALLSTLLT